MKQRITLEQVEELSEKGRKRLRGWWRPQKGDVASNNFYKNYMIERLYDEKTIFPYSADRLWPKEDVSGEHPEESWLPHLSIGQMVDFLDKYCNSITINQNPPFGWEVLVNSEKRFSTNKNEPVNVLWEAVKELLEREQRD